MDELKALRKENAALRGQLAQLFEQLARLNERVAELLAVAQRKQRKAHATVALPPPVPPPVVEGEQQRAFEERPKAPDKPVAERTAKTKTKPTGRKPLPRHLEAEEHELRPESCAACGGHALDVADELVEEKLHVVKEHQRRRVVRRYTCRCRACGERTTLRSLPAPYERSKVTCEWLAWLVYQKFWLLSPLATRRCEGGRSDASGKAPSCFYELNRNIVIDAESHNNGFGGLVGQVGTGNSNLRHVDLALNLVGTGLLDCSSSSGASCNAPAFVEYDLEHLAYNSAIQISNNKPSVSTSGLRDSQRQGPRGRACLDESFVRLG